MQILRLMKSIFIKKKKKFRCNDFLIDLNFSPFTRDEVRKYITLSLQSKICQTTLKANNRVHV